jgi:hypothetical protein
MLSVLCSFKLVLNGHDVQFIVKTTIIHENINDVKGAIRSRQLTRWQKKKEKKRKNMQAMIDKTPSRKLITV